MMEGARRESKTNREASVVVQARDYRGLRELVDEMENYEVLAFSSCPFHHSLAGCQNTLNYP